MIPRLRLPGVAALVLASCSTILGIEDPPSRSRVGAGAAGFVGFEEFGGAAGDLSTGGVPNGGSPETGGSSATAGRATGGSGNASSGGRSSGNAGEPTSEGGSAGRGGGATVAGAAGNAAAGRGGTGAGGAGAGGDDGGQGGSHVGVFGESCDHDAELACESGTIARRLVCRHGAWSRLEDCINGPCDRRVGTCGTFALGCTFADPGGPGYCDAATGEGVTCSEDLTQLHRTYCVFGCAGNGDCIDPTADQLIIDKPPSISDNLTPLWPLSAIPVCFDPESNATTGEIEVIREEIEASWSRYSAIDFSGFGECEETLAAARVEIRFRESCNGELGGIDRLGYPGHAGASHVFLCRQFVDASGATQGTYPELLRMVVRHEFGHVLGYPDDTSGFVDDGAYPLMLAGVETARLSELLAQRNYVVDLHRLYGRKPTGSLVTAGGECLTRLESGFALADCTGDAAQQFGFTGEQFGPQASSGECLRALPTDNATQIGPCTAPVPPEETFVLYDVLWRGYGALCVTVEDAAGSLTLRTQRCGSTEPLAQQFRFHFQTDGRFRIENTGNDVCVGIRAEDEVRPEDPVLTACDDPTVIFDGFRATSAGQVHFNGQCFWFSEPLIGDTVRLDPCELVPDTRFNLTGRIENPTYGAITLIGDGDDVRLELWESGSPGEQTLDFHF